MNTKRSSLAKGKLKKSQASSMVIATNVSGTVDGLSKKATPLFKIVDAFTIKTTEDQENLVTVIQQIKAYGKQAEIEKARFDDPAKAILAQSKTFFKPFLNSVDEATALGKHKILVFVNKREKTAEKVDEQLESGKIKKLSTAISKQVELETNHNTRKIYKLTIVDARKIPREFLMPDESLIRHSFKEGVSVPGCIWEQENIIAI